MQAFEGRLSALAESVYVRLQERPGVPGGQGLRRALPLVREVRSLRQDDDLRRMPLRQKAVLNIWTSPTQTRSFQNGRLSNSRWRGSGFQTRFQTFCTRNIPFPRRAIEPLDAAPAEVGVHVRPSSLYCSYVSIFTRV